MTLRRLIKTAAAAIAAAFAAAPGGDAFVHAVDSNEANKPDQS